MKERSKSAWTLPPPNSIKTASTTWTLRMRSLIRACAGLDMCLEPEALKNLYLEFVKEFPIVSIEDPFDQDGWDSWTSMTAATPIQIVGDDLTVTNPER